MAWIDENLTKQFGDWERRGRGWQVFDSPICPEPPFRPFYDHYLTQTPPEDDGRRPTILSSFVQRLSRDLRTDPPAIQPADQQEEEPEPENLVRGSLVELRISLPRGFDPPRGGFGLLLQSVSPCAEPLCFELIGLPNETTLQLALSASDSTRVWKSIGAFFPEITTSRSSEALERAWHESESDTAIVEFGLAREFMLPLATQKLDPFISIAAALSELQPGELGLFQVLFEPVRASWGESITRALTHADGKPFFVNQPELAKAGEAKAAQSLFAAVVRIATRAASFDRAWTIARDLASALRVFAHPTGNELIPLANDDYPFDTHVEDVLRRQTRRCGMILTLEELLGFVHLPSTEVPKLSRETSKTKAAPGSPETGLLLGHNSHGGQTVEVRLSSEQRVRHTHVIGASGTGKTTLLYNLIRQDIENGEGLAVLDPHGDLIDRIVDAIPQERLGDVVLVDPADEQYSIGFNILSAHSELEKHLLASDLVSVFQRLSASWGDQMGSVLQNAILAFLESARGGTLAELRRFLIEPAFRVEFLKTVEDPEVLYYWQKAFPQLTGNKSIGPVLTRLNTFLAPKPVRYMVSQQTNHLDFADVMDTGKIFLAKLSEGLLGKENSYLLGALLVSKFHQIAMSRQAQRTTARKDFWLYMDEFQNFITPSLAEILTGARKYRMGLILAHHELRQLDRDKEVGSAVLSNCHTRVVFRVGDDDARKLSEGFASFDSRDLQNLALGQAICRVERSDFDFNLSVPPPDEPDPQQARGRRGEVLTISRQKYGTARANIERKLRNQTEPLKESQAPSTFSPLQPSKGPLPKAPPISTSPKLFEIPKPKPLEERAAQGLAADATAVRDLGRGGAQHKAIQRRIKQAAERLGFRSVIEAELAEKNGSVDLLLERHDRTIACEISITTTIDHEVGNVAKCLKANFPGVAVICIDDERLQKIACAVSGSLGLELAARVSYFQPDQFIDHLRTLAEPVPKAPDVPQTRRGYKINRIVSKLSPEEQKLREDAAIRLIAETMRKKPTPSRDSPSTV